MILYSLWSPTAAATTTTTTSGAWSYSSSHRHPRLWLVIPLYDFNDPSPASSIPSSIALSPSTYDFLQYQQLQLPPFIPYSDHSSVIKETEKEERKLLLPAPIVLPIVIMSPEDRQRKLFVSTVGDFALIYACSVPILSFQHQHEHENLLMHEDR